MKSTTRFRQLIERPEVLPALGGYDALSATVAEQAGGEVVYMSGSSVSTSVHGGPDVGLTTMTEMVERARSMVEAVDVPVFCDADTGYGNPLNVARTVESYERAGVAGVHIEDQTFPKRCGHFEGTDVVPVEEMEQKLRAATDARTDDDFVVIARTDARATAGLDAAIERGYAYADAGADVLFVEALRSEAELRRVAETVGGEVPLLANMTEGGKTPLYAAEEFEAFGYDVVLYPATGFKAAAKALQDVYREILTTGTQEGVMDRLLSWSERNELTGLDAVTEREQRYATDDSDAA
ncbi:carboxyvinyl-carboxyphosphonate phosphorylmutase [Salinigranum rubrum]|uniref:Carboxyvinyl-carboxyphosphonate phosphorylmutase n=1 Tax=Salinigranum rubrum TaxID=755307 RepID=A0A2I8VFV4_9EURY|nr:isocitrate lyase/phosphoenolpyruvate mutase family protein [Salinigranum rubrum]AUV80813.1 carboxyvinyl-carboxyphosphonate phosphorylmutase [Salinigranum rubrum]